MANKNERNYKKYLDTIVASHIYQIETILKKNEEYQLSPTDKKERAILLMIDSAMWQHAAYLTEVKRFGGVVFGEEPKFSEEIEELIETVKKLQVVARDGVLETANGVLVDEIIEKLRSLNE